MSHIDIFYQGEGLLEVQHLEVEAEATIALVKEKLAQRHKLSVEEVVLFLEDDDEQLAEVLLVKECAPPTGLKLHFHRCNHIHVAVTFNGETVDHTFRPGATVARVKRWAAERKFGMTEEEAGEHVLQLAGTPTRPTPGTHIGSLAVCPGCRLAFDLVPNERINGAMGR